MDLVEYIKNSISLYFENLDKNYKYLEKKITWKEVLFVVLGIAVLSSLISTMVDSVSNPTVSMGILEYLGVIFGILIFMPIFMLISYGILHGMFKLFGGKATFVETFKFGMSVSIFPSLVFMLLGLIPMNYMDDEVSGFIFAAIFFLIAIGFMVWSLIVSAKVYSKLHSISFGKAVIAMIIPMFLILILIVFIAIIVMMTYFTGNGIY